MMSLYPDEIEQFSRKKGMQADSPSLPLALAEAYHLDAVVTGTFDLKVDDYWVATKGTISSKIVFKNPLNGSPMIGPFQKIHMELDKTILGKIVSVTGPDVVSSALNAILLIVNESLSERPSKEEKHHRFISYLAFAMLRDVPEGPDRLRVPRRIEFAMKPAEKPLGFKDEVQMHVIATDGYQGSDSEEFVAMGR